MYLKSNELKYFQAHFAPAIYHDFDRDHGRDQKKEVNEGMGREAVKHLGICDMKLLQTGEMLLIKVTVY